MGTISPAQVSDGTTIDASDVNNPINTITNEFNGNIDNSNVKSAAAIDASKLAGGNTGMFGAFVSWTPTWANLTIGNGVATAKYQQIGKQITCVLSLVLGTTTTVGTAPTFTLPVTAAGTGTYPTASLLVMPLGIGSVLDSGTGGFLATVHIVTTTTGKFLIYGAGGATANTTDITSTAPMTWATNDMLTTTFTYEAA